MVADGAEEVDGGNHGIATTDLPPLPSWPTCPQRPPDSDEFFRELAAIVSAPEWRRSRLQDFLKHGTIFAFKLLVISFALASLANALGHWAMPAVVGTIAIMCPWPYWLRRGRGLAWTVLCGLLTMLWVWVSWWAMPW
jgi:hypothetical protein